MAFLGPVDGKEFFIKWRFDAWGSDGWHFDVVDF